MLGLQRRDPDRLLPADIETRAVARELYRRVAARPILSPHGHVPAEMLALDQPFTDPAELLITRDHYVTRLLHASGVSLDALGLGSAGKSADPREVWRILASNWHLFAGTASGYWLEEELTEVLDIDDELSAETADSIYDQITDRLSQPEFRPRALFERFGIELLATTDDPLDDLAHHRALRDSGFSGRVTPTFRPDAYLDPAAPGFPERVQRLLSVTGESTSFAGYLRALEARRAHFIENGAFSADHGVVEPLTAELDAADAEALFQKALAGEAGPADARLFRAHMLLQMARMSVADGLVMTVHAGVFRNHSSATLEQYGPDTGHDVPLPTSFVEGMRPLLERYGLEPSLHLVLFTVDETAFSRELAPLAGFYPSVYAGAPWWFLDAPDAIARYRSAVTETAGFYRTSGFIDDTRAFLSIPARHDTARRSDAAFLARLVREGRISMSRAEQIADDLVDSIPRGVFKL
jgi:glucuronate isomerase